MLLGLNLSEQSAFALILVGDPYLLSHAFGDALQPSGPEILDRKMLGQAKTIAHTAFALATEFGESLLEALGGRSRAGDDDAYPRWIFVAVGTFGPEKPPHYDEKRFKIYYCFVSCFLQS
jgi:hypothetical protein